MTAMDRNKDMGKQILCTLGPASLKEGVLERLEDLGVSLFRINLSHTRLKDVAPTVEFIRARSKVPICLDSEGAQIRTGDFAAGSIDLRENSRVRVRQRMVPGDSGEFNLYPREIVRELRVGDFISIDFNAVLVQVIDIEGGGEVAVMRVLTGGRIGRNKAVTVERDIAMPPLTAKDGEALHLGRELGIRHVALSFASRGADVEAMREVVGSQAFVISKIESLSGLANIDAIAKLSDALLIDRGDLSRQVPIEQIPLVQKRIIERGRQHGVKVYVATNLLESMVTSTMPTRAEVNDIYNTLLDGADGLVLAAETAIGAHPVRCASMVVKLIREFEKPPAVLARLPDDPVSLLVKPHGGVLVRNQASADDLASLADLPRLVIDEKAAIDAAMLAQGFYSPLSGFMGSEDVKSVLARGRLADHTAWPMPIVLEVDATRAAGLEQGTRVALTDAAGRVCALLDIGEMYALDLKSGGVCLAGSVKAVEGSAPIHGSFELTPAQTRFVFASKGWSRVVGVCARRPAVRRDELMANDVLSSIEADGILVSPATGPGGIVGFSPAAVAASYRNLLEFGFLPLGRAVLGGFPFYPRRRDWRDTILAALCLKNMGCSHFLCGSEELAEAEDRFDDFGIVAIDAGSTKISAADAKAWDDLSAGRPVGDDFMREEAQAALRET